MLCILISISIKQDIFLTPNGQKEQGPFSQEGLRRCVLHRFTLVAQIVIRTGFDVRMTRSTPLDNLRRPLISDIIGTTEADYSGLVTNLSSKAAATECSDECKLLVLG